MKYFLIEADRRINNAPQIVSWYKKMDVRDICLKKAHRIPARELLYLESNSDTIFTDIISIPFFLVSAKIKQVIQMYDPNIILKEIVLLDKIYERAERYFLPIFDELECMHEDSEFNTSRSIIKKIVLRKKAIGENTIFRIANYEKQYIIGNLDIVESILRRNCIGLQLTELEIKE